MDMHGYQASIKTILCKKKRFELLDVKLMEHTGNLIADLIIPEDDLEITDTETTYEMNLALFKIKRTVKKRKS
ncbi:hypothetical protein [Legionella sp.]|uniref:hypothetical protein n=1 Tax=Legionella sp. TaxID=459 RepID=UPI003D0F8F34